jgi:hypothetical protein
MQAAVPDKCGIVTRTTLNMENTMEIQNKENK